MILLGGPEDSYLGRQCWRASGDTRVVPNVWPAVSIIELGFARRLTYREASALALGREGSVMCAWNRSLPCVRFEP